MAWVQWDDKTGYGGIIRNIDPAIADRGSAYLALIGYRELVVREPETFIPRFPRLLGRSEFTKLPDGRILQTFPEADFSVLKVREELARMVHEAAGRELMKTDWYVTRKAELGTKIPAEVVTLRANIRAHVDWIVADLQTKDARSLVDYQWMFPLDSSQTMINGTPVVVLPTPPEPLPPVPAYEPEEIETGAGFNPDVVVMDGTDTTEPAPPPPAEIPRPDPPPTTDGPVPIYLESEEHPHLDADGFPLINAYDPSKTADSH